jgi:quinol monooxygenase YgiN
MGELIGIIRLRFHDDSRREEFERLAERAMEIVRAKDPGTLQYDTFMTDDRSECLTIERFRDSDALIAHAANIGDLADAVLATATVVHGELLGDPSPELRALLAEGELPVVFTPYRSMA